jgi:hypothetical protein
MKRVKGVAKDNTLVTRMLLVNATSRRDID